jgi:hypothetical protein
VIIKLAPIASRKLQKRSSVHNLLRQLSSDDEQDDSLITPLSSEDPDKPWKRDYNAHMDTVHDVPEGMSTVQWWGVREPHFHYLSAAYIAFSTIAIDMDLFGRHLLETTFQSWLHRSRVSAHPHKVA